MRRTITIAALAIAAPVMAQSAAPAAPGWMAGCWVQKGGTSWTEECWTSARGGTMLGSGRSGTGDVVKSWEATQILPDDKGRPVFWGSPEGATRVPFAMVSQNAIEIVFANPGHDYPQRIRYWRDGATLNAEISLADGSKAMRWRYAPMR